MKDFGWKIKISDLLRTPGKEDEIPFEKKFVPEIKWITEDGISGVIIVKALDRYSVLVSIENLSTSIEDVSDISWEPFTREVNNPFYEALFIIPHEEKKKIRKKDEADEYFEINEKDESIDITEMVQNAIIAVQPIVKADENENLSESEEDVESDFDQYV